MSFRFRKIPARIRRRWMQHIVWPWHAQVNWNHGYARSPIMRCRGCDHTAPYHYPHCVQYGDRIQKEPGQ